MIEDQNIKIWNYSGRPQGRPLHFLENYNKNFNFRGGQNIFSKLILQLVAVLVNGIGDFFAYIFVRHDYFWDLGQDPFAQIYRDETL